ncbi:MAG TPA: hypothetical protein VHA11_13345 [Bryobacteraceae bacterium]|nr:hypothetical protein [Bryobacteraceae bacterium]
MRHLLLFTAASLALAAEPLPRTVTPLVEDGSAWRQDGNTWTLAAGQAGILEAPAWWTGNRPPEGPAAVLEFEFQDTLPRAARAEVWSGLGTTDPYSELHRFGGTGDGQWKTARVPVSGGFLFSYEPRHTARFRILPAAGTLKARAFRLAAPRPGDEQQYNAETRAWVAREQRRAAILPESLPKPQAAVLPGAWSSRALVPYRRNWMDLIQPGSAPRAGEAGAPLRVRMFRNEFEPLELGVFANGRALKNVRIAADPVKDASGAEIVSVTPRVAEYAKVHTGVSVGYNTSWFPQRLWPAYAFDVPAGESRMVWLVLGTRDQTARPGKYETSIRFTADGIDEVVLPLTVEVLNSRLLTMEEAGLKLGGCTTGLVPEFELRFLRQYNHNMVNIWYQAVRPQLSRQGATFGLDFRVMDDWMASARRAGISDLVYFLGGDPYIYPRTFGLGRSLAETMLGLNDAGWAELSNRNRDAVPEKIAPLMVEWTRRFSEHARAAGWPNVILTPFDEPAKHVQYRSGVGMLSFIKPQFKQQVRLLREGDPKAQIYGSIHHYAPGIGFLEDVDVFCTNAIAENPQMPEQVHGAGKTFWEYSGNGDSGLPGVARYTFGYYFASHGSTGSLVWAYNWGDRFDTLDGNNWLYAWNTPFDVIPSPYMEGMREAWDDRRLIETVRQAARKKGVDISGFLGRLFADVARARGAGGTDTVTDFWEKSRSDEAMDEWKDRLVDELLSLATQ